jgi:hypothetical protein
VALSNYFTGLNTAATATPFANAPNADAMVQSSLEAMLNPNSQYVQNARQRGVEYAASRGGLNSSIAAGASERAAIEGVMPLVQESLGIQQSREQVQAQNWLQEQGFNREIQGALTMMPVQSAFNMLSTLQEYAINDPALYTPDVMSGFSNFFTQNMDNIISQYFGGNG